ncbi:MAG: SDR family oxidoreductase [Alphaproteobacteria bacterium]|nr:SDR family oxidoreductase [Alphaproteobacteria bacterium]
MDRRANTALVTGAARRIGRDIARALARDGWAVAVHCNRSVDEAAATVAAIEGEGGRAVALAADIADPAAAGALVGRAAAALGPVGLLVNNASLFEPDTIATLEPATVARHMAVNLQAPLLLARALAGGLPNGAEGIVVNLLDQKLANPNPDFLSYTLSKAALGEATRLLAMALAPRVRVVAVAPGLTLPAPGQSAAQFATVHGRTPLGRGAAADDIARAVVWLASARAVTGVTLLVDGGQHLVPSATDVVFLPAGETRP